MGADHLQHIKGIKWRSIFLLVVGETMAYATGRRVERLWYLLALLRQKPVHGVGDMV